MFWKILIINHFLTIHSLSEMLSKHVGYCDLQRKISKGSRTPHYIYFLFTMSISLVNETTLSSVA